MMGSAVFPMTTRSVGWAGLLCALASLTTSSGCGGQATSQSHGASKCDPGTKCVAPDGGDPPACGPGTVWNGSSCVLTYGTGGTRSTGGRPGSGGAPSYGGTVGTSGAPSYGGTAGTSGSTSAEAGPGSGGVSTHPDGGDASPPVPDTTPPVFGGIGSGSGMSRHTAGLSWTAATDNATDSSRIVYAVYESDVAGGEDFAAPLLITDPGATLVTIEGLTYATQYAPHYFIVRARDRAGNEEQNTVEIRVDQKTSFATDVQPIFTQSCAVQICHTVGDGTNPPILGLNLEEGAAYTNIVNVVARQGVMINPPEPNLKRIDGTSTNPMDSYLWRKLQKPALSNIYGNTDPPPQSPRMLTSGQVQVITDWIAEGSLNN